MRYATQTFFLRRAGSSSTRRWVRIGLLMLSFSVNNVASAAGQPVSPGCFVAAAARYGVSETLLRAVAKVESNFRADALHQDADGTHDVGVMQINSSHFERLRLLGISESTLVTEPCTNIAVGASILAGFVRQFGMTWRAVGCYGAGTHPKKEAARVAYATLVQRSLDRIAGSDPRGLQATSSTASFAPRTSSEQPASLLVLE